MHMVLSPIIEEDVTLLDLRVRGSLEGPVLKYLREAIVHTNSGVVDMFKVLVCDNFENLVQHQGWYQKLLEDPLTLKVIVLATTNGESIAKAMKAVQIPEVLRSNSESLRFLIIEDEVGLYFATGSMNPQALAVWPDATGEPYALDIVADALINPEVFSEVFEQTKNLPYQAFSVGTRQAWFGTVPTPAISDALTEVGKGIVGGDGFGALERRPINWEIPAVLAGDSVESDILTDTGSLSEGYSAALKSINQVLNDFAVKSNRLVVKRIALFPNRQIESASNTADKIDNLEKVWTELVDQVDASDGFGNDETHIVEGAGIRLFRDDANRSTLRGEIRVFFDIVVKSVVNGLRDGHSIAPYLERIDKSLERLRPKSKGEISEAYSEFSLGPKVAILRDAQSSVPKGFRMWLAVFLARCLLQSWAMMTAGLFLFFGTVIAIGDIWDLEFIGSTFQDGKSWDSVSEVVVAALLFFLAFSAYLLSHATGRIRRWGNQLQIHQLQGVVNSQRAFVEKTVLNDWVLNKLRRAAMEPIMRLKNCLEDMMKTLQDLLIDGNTRQGIESFVWSCNPAIRSSNAAGAQVGIFKNLPLVNDILRIDVVKILQKPIESYAFAFLGGDADGIAHKITEEAAVPLEKYISSLMKYGIYSRYHIVDTDEGAVLRQQLINEYWSDNDSVNRLLKNVVLAPDAEPVVQFIRAETLVQLDGDIDKTRVVRFAPRPSRLDDMFQSADEKSRMANVVLTRSASIGGVLRFIGFKEGAV